MEKKNHLVKNTTSKKMHFKLRSPISVSYVNERDTSKNGPMTGFSNLFFVINELKFDFQTEYFSPNIKWCHVPHQVHFRMEELEFPRKWRPSFHSSRSQMPELMNSEVNTRQNGKIYPSAYICWLLVGVQTAVTGWVQIDLVSPRLGFK